MQNRGVVLAVVGGLVAATLIALCGIIFLANGGHPIPDGLVPIATGALGALAGLLASTRTTVEEPQAVEVQQPAGEPLLTHETARKRPAKADGE